MNRRQRIARLLEIRGKLRARLPLAQSEARQRKIARRLNRVDRELAALGHEPGPPPSTVAGLDGVGSLEFTVASPPGLGRLVRLPFYPDVANAGTVTDQGAGLASTTNPVFIENPALAAAPNLSAGQHVIRTPAISWAVLRVVGFETNQRSNKGAATPGPMMMVADLQLGGGANLFTHADFADAMIYDANHPEFCGLRDYPILKSPNTMTATVQQVNNIVAEETTFSACVLAEVLVDDNYGSHIPGPYARSGAMVRSVGGLR